MITQDIQQGSLDITVIVYTIEGEDTPIYHLAYWHGHNLSYNTINNAVLQDVTCSCVNATIVEVKEL